MTAAPHNHHETRTACLLLVLLLLLQATLAARIVPNREASSSSLIDDALGSARALLAANFYNRADLYFHRGVPHTETRAMHHAWFERAHRTIAPRDHTHAEGDAIADILPWLMLAVQTDPTGEEAYVVAAHWLSRSLGRHEEALLLLRDGLLNVPHPHALLVSRGKVLLRQHDWEGASRSLAVAIRLLRETYPEPDRDALIDIREALLLHAFACEAANRIPEAIGSLSDYLACSDSPPPSLQARLHTLKSGGTPLPHASAFFAAQEADEHDAISCSRGDHDHD